MFNFISNIENANWKVINNQCIINADALNVLHKIPNCHVDVVITSPPYNLKVNYGTYKDNLTIDEYLSWTESWISQIRRVLKEDGSFFLNIAGSASHLNLPMLVLSVAQKCDFILQNHIIWVKSVFVPGANDGGHTYGHFKPINSSKYLNNTFEHIFHFTASGKVDLHKLDIGVRYSDESNINRWNHKHNKRCGGNVWMVPYKTRMNSAQHPAMFPIEIPEKCILLHLGKNKERNGLIMDPFAGVGTTMQASMKTNCYSIGIELHREYYELCGLNLLNVNGN